MSLKMIQGFGVVEHHIYSFIKALELLSIIYNFIVKFGYICLHHKIETKERKGNTESDWSHQPTV
jgi:hypothetical protein